MDIKPPAPSSPLDGPMPHQTPGGAPPTDDYHTPPQPAAPAGDAPKEAVADTDPHPWSMNDIPPASPAEGEPKPGAHTSFDHPVSTSVPSAASDTPAPVIVGSSEPIAPTTPEPSATPPHMPASAGPDEPAAPVAAPLPVAMQHKKKKTKLIALIVVLLVLVLGAGSAAAYVGYYLPNKPENVLGKALLNSFSPDVVKSANFEGKLDMAKDGKTAGSMTFSGKADQSGAFDVSAKVDALVASLTVDSRSVDGKTFYVRLGGLEGLAPLLANLGSEAASFAPIINAVNNQWFEINESLIKQYTQGSSTKLSDADRQKIVDAYKPNQFIIVKTVLPNQDIKGTSSYHYKLGIDRVKAKAFMSALKNAKPDSIKLTDEEVKAFNTSVDKGGFDKFMPEVWITKDTRLIKQVQLVMNESGQTVTLALTIDDYNKPVKVDKPTNAKSVLELLQMVLGTSNPLDQKDLLKQQVKGISL